MDAIAFLMFAEPPVLPTPRSEAPLDAPFDTFVAAAANNKEPNGDDSPSSPNDTAAAQAGIVSAIVSQWLAQRESTPSLPIFARGIVDVRPSLVPEAALSPGRGEEAAPPPEDLPTTETEEQTPETVEPITTGNAELPHAATGHDPIAFGHASPDQGSTTPAPRTHTEAPRVPIQQLMPDAADIGWNGPHPETRLTSADPKTSVPLEAIEKVLEKLQASAPHLRLNTVPDQQAVESQADRPARSPAMSASEPPVPDDPNGLNGVQKAMIAPDRTNISKQSGPVHELTRTLESVQTSTTTPSSNANTLSPAADSISAASPTIISAAESSADMPVKLAIVAREGQTAEMQTLALHIAARWAKGESRFTIRLDPPELGRIDVNLNVSSHGLAQAVLAVEKPQTLDLLLRDAPTLERALKDAGLELGGNLSFSLKEEGRQTFAYGDQHSAPSRTVELVPAEAAKPHAVLNASLIEQFYGSRMARLDITI